MPNNIPNPGNIPGFKCMMSFRMEREVIPLIGRTTSYPEPARPIFSKPNMGTSEGQITDLNHVHLQKNHKKSQKIRKDHEKNHRINRKNHVIFLSTVFWSIDNMFGVICPFRKIIKKSRKKFNNHEKILNT